MLEVNWGVLFGLLVILVLVVLAVAMNESNGEELPCLLFNDGKLAIINVESYYVDEPYCKGSDTTIAWFLQKGYNISGSISGHYTVDQVYMTR